MPFIDFISQIPTGPNHMMMEVGCLLFSLVSDVRCLYVMMLIHPFSFLILVQVWNPLGIVGVITAFNFPCAVLGKSIYSPLCVSRFHG